MSAQRLPSIGLYDPDGPTTGSNAVTVHMAAILARLAPTRIIAAGPMARTDDLEAFFGADLSQVEYVHVADHRPVPVYPGLRRVPRSVFQVLVKDRRLSRGHDLWIASAGWHVMPRSAAPRSVLYCHFPYWSMAPPSAQPVRGLRKMSFELQRRINGTRVTSYDLVLANSEYTAGWIRERWGIGARVLYPPVRRGDLAPGIKENLIISVGRVDRMDTKNHAAAVRAFQRFASLVGGDWRLVIVGTLERDQESRRSLKRLMALDRTGRVEFRTNIPRQDLVALLGAAKMYWHCKGLGNLVPPEYREHFGISTVEAMMAGCVPVVPAAGGQPEIVEDGSVGFVCRDEEEIAQAAADVAASEHLCRDLAAAAMDSAERFTVERFEAGLLDVLSRKWPELGLGTDRHPSRGEDRARRPDP